MTERQSKEREDMEERTAGRGQERDGGEFSERGEGRIRAEKGRRKEKS